MGAKITSNIDGLLLNKLKVIPVENGDVFHGIKDIDPGFSGFGELYFSTVLGGKIKTWKRHKEMTLNLMVPYGKIKFVIFDDREGSPTEGSLSAIVLSPDNYYRLTVPPMLWMAFQGQNTPISILANCANIKHRPGEEDRVELNEINYYWDEFL